MFPISKISGLINFLNTAQIVGKGPVLVVDDDTDFHFVIRSVFKKSIIENPLVVLASGASCLDYMESVRVGKVPMPALVLLDVNMPALSGFDTLKQIRARPEFVKVPVVSMLSNSDDESDVRRSIALGANDFLTKPFEINDFVQMINGLAPSV